MAALINQLDVNTQKQIGENGHEEYGWSNNIREKIVQLSFQITRMQIDKDMDKLENELFDILANLYPFKNEENNMYLTILYKMIGHTRDIINGKGEYAITYMMIYTWYKFYPDLAFHAIDCLFDIGENAHPYGSYKDIKYFCDYVKNRYPKELFYKPINLDDSINHPLIQYTLCLANNKLAKDVLIVNANEPNETISLIAKWLPREKSKYGYLFNHLAYDYFKTYIKTAKTPEKLKKAEIKCKTDYRKLLSKLNKQLDTLQIKQCDRRWAQIEFDNVTSISMMKQKTAFLNKKKNGQMRYDVEDRINCSNNFKEHIELVKNGIKEAKGKRIGLNDFTKEALKLLEEKDKLILANRCKCSITEICKTEEYRSIELQCDLLNELWKNNSKQNDPLRNMIAMVDVSGSMDGEPLNSAIALGIRVAEKSLLGKRVMTFSHTPCWVNLENDNTFVEMVSRIKTANWGTNTNFYAALNMILDAIIETKMTPDEVSDMSLVIFSDMQMDVAIKDTKARQTTLYESIKEKYEDAGLRVHGKPYKVPHILFWNLRFTNGFPVLSIQPNVSMMSGFSPVLLNHFCEKGLTALNDYTPWKTLQEMLSNKRYDILENKIKEFTETNAKFIN